MTWGGGIPIPLWPRKAVAPRFSVLRGVHFTASVNISHTSPFIPSLPYRLYLPFHTFSTIPFLPPPSYLLYHTFSPSHFISSLPPHYSLLYNTFSTSLFIPSLPPPPFIPSLPCFLYLPLHTFSTMPSYLLYHTFSTIPSLPPASYLLYLPFIPSLPPPSYLLCHTFTCSTIPLPSLPDLYLLNSLCTIPYIIISNLLIPYLQFSPPCIPKNNIKPYLFDP